MKDDAKIRFKRKFYWLTVELNIIVMLAALSIIVFFIIRSPYTLPAVLAILAVTLVVSLDFAQRYKETKAWTNAQPEKSKEGEDSKQNDKAK